MCGPRLPDHTISNLLVWLYADQATKEVRRLRVFYNGCRITGWKNRPVENGVPQRAILIASLLGTVILGLSACSAHACCTIQVSATTWLENGCGAVHHTDYVHCTLGPQCIDAQPTFHVSGPLGIQEVGKVGVRHYMAVVVCSPPSGCSQNGTVWAVASTEQISNTCTIAVKKLGPFELGYLGTGDTNHYRGEQTFKQLGILPPSGCDEDDPAYGCLTTSQYTLSIGCPLPMDKAFSEELEAGAGCECAPTNPWSFVFPEEKSGDEGISDDIGVMTCDCDDIRLIADEACKTKQTLKIGDCVLAQRCIDVNRSGGGCLTLTQTVSNTEGWNGCNCF